MTRRKGTAYSRKEDLRNFRVLVTGAAGFVGSNLCRRLNSSGVEVHAVTRDKTDCWRLQGTMDKEFFHTVDLRTSRPVENLMGRIQPEVVFHCAVSSAYDSSLSLKQMTADDLAMTRNLLDAAAKSGACRIVHLGSFLEYRVSDKPHSETDFVEPLTRRGLSKAASTQLVLERTHSIGLEATVLRVFSVYGPWEHTHRLVPRAIRAAMSGDELPLTEEGIRRDFIFTEDVVDACLKAATADGISGEIFNIGSGREYANEEIIEEVQRVTGRRIAVRAGSYPLHEADRRHSRADIKKAQKVLQWRPRHSLPEGLRKTVEWFQLRNGFGISR